MTYEATKPGSERYDEMWDAYHRFHFLCDTARFQKIFSRADLVRIIADVPGDIVDAGAYKGMSTILFAHLIETYRPHSMSKVVAFDTFDMEFPHARDFESGGLDVLRATHDTNAYERLRQAIDELNLQKRIELVKGDIVTTLPAYLERNRGFRISLLHCDLDTYGPTLETLKAAWPRVVKGGVVVFDQYGDPRWGESDAADEFFATLDNPPRLRSMPSAPHTPTAYCIKE